MLYYCLPTPSATLRTGSAAWAKEEVKAADDTEGATNNI
jgi:hypothetical protein